MTGADPDARPRRDGRPPRLLPVLYFAVAHLCLVAGLGSLALNPVAAAGFFRQPLTLAATHLLTLGWIGGSILGSLYIVGPLALRTPICCQPTGGAPGDGPPTGGGP